MSKQSLQTRIHESNLMWDICKIVGYGGFRFRELAAKMKPLVDQYGARKVSSALFELVQHTGWVTSLNPQARKACFSVLGPAPEQWDWFYTNGLGQPTPRPAHHQTPPEVPPPQVEPILDALSRLTATELDMRLRQSRAVLRRDAPAHQRELAEETIPRVESEMVRRGEEIPPQEEVEEAVPKKKRTRKTA